MYFSDVVEGLGHTPLVELAGLSPGPRVRVLAKLEGQSIGGSASVKDRIARYMLEQAEKSGALTRDKVILEATSGNTGIALAWLGRKKGYQVTIIMPENMSVERQQLMRLYGAELILTKAALKVTGAIDVARDMAARDPRYFMPDQFCNPANPLAHYETTAAEILADFPYERIDALIVGIGTGGTITGVARRLREKFPQVQVIGVEPPLNDAIQGLRCLEEYVPPVLDLRLVSQRAKVTGKQAEEATRQLLEREGIFAGVSSGAVAYQAMKTAREMKEGNIVVVLPDGGWKYLSMDFWWARKRTSALANVRAAG